MAPRNGLPPAPLVFGSGFKLADSPLPYTDTHTQALKTTIRRNTQQEDMGEQDLFNFDQPDSHDTIIL